MKKIKVIYVEVDEAWEENDIVSFLRRSAMRFITQPAVAGDLDDVEKTLKESWTTGFGIQTNVERY